MATESEHRQQAQHNAELLATFDHARFPDWAATVAFYQAVHLIEMLFAHDGRTPSGSHKTRNQILKRHYPDLWKEYRPLYAFSRTARYWCMKVNDTHVAYVLRRLRRVEHIVAELVR
jgi:hypothetical protein